MRKLLIITGIVFLIHFLLTSSLSFSQQELLEKDQYRIVPGERLMITVHIFGEVRQPGEYLVPDDTNILELISKAGGPTEYSNLNNVKITRGLFQVPEVKRLASTTVASDTYVSTRTMKKQVIKVDLNKLLDKEKYNLRLPVMQPGDVVRIGRNAWFTWQAVIRVVSQLAIVAQVWYWYSKVD